MEDKSNRMNTFPRCEVCLEHFTLKGPAPYLLPCLHAVCETCVTSAAGRVISCSTCQREINLTETHLQKDVVRQSEIFHLTAKHRSSELLCTHEDDGNQAVCWCQECEELLCEYCQTLHEGFKATRRHTVKEIEKIQSDQINHEQFCSVHKTCPLDFWDRTCDVLICSRCRRDEHDDHDVEDVSVAADTTRGDIEDIKAQVLLTTNRHRIVVETATDHLKHAEETAEILREKISHTFHSLKSCIDQREKEILLELDRQNKAEAEILTMSKTASESGHLMSQSATEYIDKALLFTSKHHLLTVKKTIKERTQICLAGSPPGKPRGFLDFDFATVGLDMLKSTVSCFGKIAAVEPLSPEFSQDMDTLADVGDVMHSASFENSQGEETQVLVREGTALQSRTTEAETQKARLMTQKRQERQEVRRLMKHCEILEAELEKIGFYCLMRGDDKPACFLKCIPLELNKNRVNLKGAFINTEGELTNDWSIKSTFVGQERGRLQKYEGTCSTFPLSHTGSSQYWETVSKIRVDQALQDSNLILEIGLAREEEQDESFLIGKQPHSYSLTVNHCMEHKGICRAVRKHGVHILCLPETFSNKAETTVSLHYGVIYNNARNIVAFLDINKNRIIAVFINIDSSCLLWPMFGVYSPRRVNVSMKLVAGEAIDMTDEKRKMILHVLA